jgi:multicomponent Na+:H+ antiporter subunit C
MSDAFALYGVVGAVLFGVGLHAVIVLPDLLRKLIAVNVMGSGTLLFLVAAAVRAEGAPDPVPHALALTGIVVTLGATAAGVALARALERLATSSVSTDVASPTDRDAP